MTRRYYYLDYPFSPAETVESFRGNYGPTHRAFNSLHQLSADKLRKELETLWSSHNRASDELTFVAAKYLEMVATRA